MRGDGGRPGTGRGADGAAAWDAATVRTWAQACCETLRDHRSELDGLNVFPVPDSDTGTNLYLTFADAAGAVARLPAGADVGAVARAFTRGAVVGARGNSGVILSQYAGALVQAASTLAAGPGAPDVTGPLRAASDAAYRAVARPVEGTVLTVARAVHEEAERSPLPGVGALDAAIEQGYVALAATTAQLPALRAAGVCDAGAWGLLLILEALARSLPDAAHRRRPEDRPDHVARPATAGLPVPRGALAVGAGVDRCSPAGGGVGGHATDTAHDASGDGEFEVMFLTTAAAGAAEQPDAVSSRLRTALAAVGESVAVVGADGLWQGHVHTDAPLAALSAPEAAGTEPHVLSVRHLASQAAVHGDRRPELGLVTVSRAPGLVPDLARAGAVVVLLPPGHTADDLARAVDDTGAQTVLVLSSVALDGVDVRRDGAPRVHVLDRLSEVQVIAGAATLAVLDPGVGAQGLTDAVAAAVDGVRCTAVTLPADVGADGHAELMHTAAASLADGSGATLLTVLTSAATPQPAVEGAVARLSTSHPGLEVVVLPGGGPGADVVLGAET